VQPDPGIGDLHPPGDVELVARERDGKDSGGCAAAVTTRATAILRARMASGPLIREDGTRIAYDVVGEGAPLVFVHGLTSQRQAWDPVTKLLARDFTCVRVDLRGHGGSSAASEYSMLSLVGDVRAVVEELALDAPAVIGNSLGANVAAVYAAAHDARAVICIDSSLRFGDFAMIVQAHADGLRGERTMEAVLAIEHELQLEPYAGIAELERRVLAFPRDIVLALWETALTLPPEELTTIAETVLPRITAPLLSLHGTPPPSDYESWLTGVVASARVELWEGSGHLLHLVDPERFAARVRSLLAEVPG
jgi:pimeloyl-ACP methyl ester carboxylesterase